MFLRFYTGVSSLFEVKLLKGRSIQVKFINFAKLQKESRCNSFFCLKK